MPSKHLPDWASLELSPSVESCGCGLGPSPVRGEGHGNPLQYSCLENPMNSMKRQKDRALKDELPRSVGAKYATGDQWRNNSRRNEEAGPKQKRRPVLDVSDGESKVKSNAVKNNIA